MVQGKAKAVHMNLHHCDIRIDRQSIWGNPFRMVDRSGAERNRVCNAYQPYFWKSDLPDKLYLLLGKRLGCHCAPKRCHGDFLAAEANLMAIYMKVPCMAKMTYPPKPDHYSYAVAKPEPRSKLYWYNEDGNPVVRRGIIEHIEFPESSDNDAIILFAYESEKGMKTIEIPHSKVFTHVMI